MQRQVNTDAKGWQNVNDYLIFNGRRWFSTAKNWRAEKQMRMETGITNPDINPQTGMRYTRNAKNYRLSTIWQRLFTDEQIKSNPQKYSDRYLNFNQ
jgi:hypothetical protein